MSGFVTEPILSVRDLTVEFHTDDGSLVAVDHVSFDLRPRETLAIVGESGSGKTVTAQAIMGLIQPSKRVRVEGEVVFDHRSILGFSEKEFQVIRGKHMAMIFQDPMTSLNPGLTVGFQVAEAIRVHHRDVSRKDAIEKAGELLEAVGIPNSRLRSARYPHEFSGGMRQRAMIAMAMANQPKVLIADEPTTALDVTIQAQVVDVLRAAREQTGAATILITHDLGLVAELADRVVVMYAGKVVEVGDVRSIFHAPHHPYTVGLLASLPRLDTGADHLTAIPGSPPSLIDLPSGCSFRTRCALTQGRRACSESAPELSRVGDGHMSACHFHEEVTRLLNDEVTIAGGGHEN